MDQPLVKFRLSDSSFPIPLRFADLPLTDLNFRQIKTGRIRICLSQLLYRLNLTSQLKQVNPKIFVFFGPLLPLLLVEIFEI